MKDWYYARNNEQIGPINKGELLDLIEQDVLNDNDLVWGEGMDDWQKIKSIPELKKQKMTNPTSKKSHGEKGTNPLSEPPANEAQVTSAYDGEASVEEHSEQVHHAPHLQGVGGWLTFFCVALTILGPLFSLGQMVSSWEEAKPAFELFPNLESAIWVENVMLTAILVYGFITGVMIWSGNEKGKVLAERYLKVRLSAVVLVELLLLGMLSDLPGEVYSALVDGVVGVLFREAILFGIWYAYFKKSKRVAATYGTRAT